MLVDSALKSLAVRLLHFDVEGELFPRNWSVSQENFVTFQNDGVFGSLDFAVLRLTRVNVLKNVVSLMEFVESDRSEVARELDQFLGQSQINLN